MGNSFKAGAIEEDERGGRSGEGRVREVARERRDAGRWKEVLILKAGTQLIDDDENGNKEEKPKPH